MNKIDSLLRNNQKSVKTLHGVFCPASKFEAKANVIVITKAANTLCMVTSIPLKNIEEEQKTDLATVEKISKIIKFLRNIED